MGYEIDLSQAENRIVALIANETKLLEAFERGDDIHSMTAYLFFGGEPTREYQENTLSPIGDGSKSQRFWGKQGNHSCNYGLGAGSASLRWEIPQKDAKIIIKKYHAIYPQIKVWHRKNEEQLKRNRTLINPYGRKRMFLGNLYNNNSIYQEAHSFVPQSTVADKINREGLIYINEHPYLTKHVQLLNQVHDSIMFQISKDLPPQEHIEILKLITKSLETPIHYEGRSLVIPTDVTAYPENFKDGWDVNLDSGKAKQKREVNGETITISETLERLF